MEKELVTLVKIPAKVAFQFTLMPYETAWTYILSFEPLENSINGWII